MKWWGRLVALPPDGLQLGCSLRRRSTVRLAAHHILEQSGRSLGVPGKHMGAGQLDSRPRVRDVAPGQLVIGRDGFRQQRLSGSRVCFALGLVAIETAQQQTDGGQTRVLRLNGLDRKSTRLNSSH